MKITKIFFAMAMLFAVACTPDNNGGDDGNKDKTRWLEEGKFCGEWKLTSWADSQQGPQVYLALNEDKTFDLYQRVYSILWLHYDGSYTLEGNTLSGVYSDGEVWKSSYIVSYAEEPIRIRLVRTSDNKDISIYTECEIPNDIIDEAKPSQATRSIAPERFL